LTRVLLLFLLFFKHFYILLLLLFYVHWLTRIIILAPYLSNSRTTSQFGASEELKYSPKGGFKRGPLSSTVMALGSASASKRIWTISSLFSTWTRINWNLFQSKNSKNA
jgi:hypothetical protein